MEQTKINELFKISPDVEELINFGKFEADIPLPTRTGLTTVKIQLLWEGEDYEIRKRSGELHDPQDMLSRVAWMKIETLVYAIKKIGDTEYYSDNKDKNELLKNSLRIIINSSSPLIADYIYSRYDELSKSRQLFFDEKTDELKKKFQETLLQIKPL